MLSFTTKGSFKNTNSFFENAVRRSYLKNLEQLAQEGLKALKEATPVESGLTAEAWSYKITNLANSYRIEYFNTHFVKGVPIAIILQYGHATRNGGYVYGRDYINPAIQPIFDKIAEKAWKEVNGR